MGHHQPPTMENVCKFIKTNLNGYEIYQTKHNKTTTVSTEHTDTQIQQNKTQDSEDSVRAKKKC